MLYHRIRRRPNIQPEYGKHCYLHRCISKSTVKRQVDYKVYLSSGCILLNAILSIHFGRVIHVLEFFILCYNHSYKLKTGRAIKLLTARVISIKATGFYFSVFDQKKSKI